MLVYDRPCPVFHPDEPKDLEKLVTQREELRKAVFEQAYIKHHSKYVSFWSEVAALESAVEAGIAKAAVTGPAASAYNKQFKPQRVPVTCFHVISTHSPHRASRIDKRPVAVIDIGATSIRMADRGNR